MLFAQDATVTTQILPHLQYLMDRLGNACTVFELTFSLKKKKQKS